MFMTACRQADSLRALGLAVQARCLLAVCFRWALEFWHFYAPLDQVFVHITGDVHPTNPDVTREP